MNIQRYAKVAGALLLVSMVAGALGEWYIPSKLIVTGDAAATANNVVASNTLFRLGFATYLIEAICDTALSLLFYVLLRPVNRNFALLAAFFGLVSTAVFAVAELFYFAPVHILGGADYLKTFSPQQLNTLALFSLRLYGIGAAAFMAFYGIATLIRGYLVYQSTYLPKWLGVLLAIGGLGFIGKNLAFVLAPAFPSGYFLLPMPVMLVVMTAWFLVKGVDVPRYEAKAATL